MLYRKAIAPCRYFLLIAEMLLRENWAGIDKARCGGYNKPYWLRGKR